MAVLLWLFPLQKSNCSFLQWTEFHRKSRGIFFKKGQPSQVKRWRFKDRLPFNQECCPTENYFKVNKALLSFLFGGSTLSKKKQLKEHFSTILLPCKSYSVVANLSLSGLKCFTKCERSFRDSHQSTIERNRVYQRSVLTKERPKTNSLSIVCFVSLFSF